MSYGKAPWKPPRWLGALWCRIVGHHWFVNDRDNWRYCGRCQAEEVRDQHEVWKS